MVVRPSSPPAFLAAPSFSLGYSPTSVAAGHLTASGNLDLVTADYNSGHISVFRALGHGAFAPGATYAAGAQPRSVTIADINGDGMADVILANESEGVVSIFAGNGDGTLGVRKTYAVGFAPSFIAVGDFSGFGKLDVAVASASGTALAILQNDGAGGLARPMNFALSAVPAALTACDLNHDGHLDLAIANANGTVSTLLGRGNGQFSALPDISVASGALSSISVGDFNRDGNDDLVVTASAQNQVAVLLGQGNGKFAPAGFFAVGSSPVATHVADVDGDGIADLIVINKGSNTFSVLSGAGDGTFKGALNFVVGNSPLGLAAGDLYGNGHVDVATIDQLSRTLSIPVAVGDGTFVAGRAYPVGVQPVSVASGDLNGDGKADLVVADYCAADPNCGGVGSVAVLLADAGGVYHVSSTYTMGAGSVSVALLDVNGDRKPDLVALNRVDKTLSIRLGLGDGTFGSLITIPLSAAPIAVASGDFNKDGNSDLAVLGDCGGAKCTTPGEVEMLLGSGDGNFRSAGTYTVGYSPVALAVGATRTGAAPDVIVANRCGQDASCASGGTASVLYGSGAGTFTSGADLAIGNSPSSIALANLRGSGVLDLVVSRSADNTVAVLPGAGNGTFKAAVPYPVGKTPGALAIADFNGDGVPDIAVANTADSTVSVLFGKADGTLQKSFAVPVSANPAGMAAIAGATKSAPASLATTNGSTRSPQAASNVTVVPNLAHTPLVTGGIVPTIALALSTGNTGTTNVNQSASFTATVTGTTGNGAPTGGTVEFFSDGTAISDCNSAGATGITVTPGTGGSLASTAVCATSVLTEIATPGHAITAQYLGCPTAGCTATTGDQVYDNSAVSTQTVNQVVNALAATLSFTPGPTPPSPSAFQTPVTFSAALTGVTLTPTRPSGSVTFLLNTAAATCVGSTTANVIAVNTSGVATCQIANMPFSTTNVVNISYGGDTNFTVAASVNSAPYTIGAQTPQIAVTNFSPATSSPLNTSVTLTATLSPQAGSSFSPTAPTGSVTFAVGATTLCTANAPFTTSGANLTASCAGVLPGAGNNSVIATYTPAAGDTNYVTNTSTGVNYSVTAITPTVAVTADHTSPQPLNTSVIYTATLTGTFSPHAPAGTVSFSTTLGTTTTTLCTGATISASGANYIATCTTAALNAGNNSVSATFTPTNTNYVANTTSTAFPITINKLTGTLGIASSVGTSTTVGTSVTFTVTYTVSPVTPIAPATTGTPVSFTINGVASPLCPAAALNASQQATCTTTGLKANNYVIGAAYAGDTNFNSATASTINLAVNQAAPTVGLTASSATTPPVVNEPVTFTATVPTPASGTQTILPTGSVTFTQGATTLCSLPLNSAVNPPTVACNTSFPSTVAAPGTVTATYSGDGNFTAGTAGTTTGTVNTATTTVAIASSGTVSVGQTVTYTTTITPQYTGTSIPLGTVAFTTNASPAPTGSCTTPLTVLSNGNVPSCTFVFSTGGPWNVSATYTSANSNFSGNTSNTVAQAVNTGTLGINLTSGTSPSSVNQPVTFSAAFTPSIPTPIPSGTVTYTDGATTLCSVAVSGTGTIPNCTATFTSAASHSILASLPANGAYQAASSNTLAQVVNKNQVATSVSSTLASASVNQAVTFTATLTAATFTGASGTLSGPTGTVTFNQTSTAGTTSPCSNVAITNTAGVLTATCPTTFATIGTYTVSAQYNGDTNFTQGSAATTQVAVGTAGTSVSVTAPTITVYVNEATGVTFSATVTPTPAGTVSPTGSMTFTDSVTGSDVCIPQSVTANTSGGATASCPIIFRSAGSHTITAKYSGDTNFPTASNTSVITVNADPIQTFTISSSGAVAANQAVTYSTLVTPQYGGANATIAKGAVTFAAAGTTLTGTCTPSVSLALDGTVPNCTLIFPASGTFGVTATFTPTDTNFGASTSNTVSQSINKAGTTVVVAPTTASVTNQAVTFMAAFSPAVVGTQPTGTVTYNDGATPIASCTALSVAAGVIPSCTTKFANAGVHPITASYSGDSNFGATTSAVVTQPVSPAATTAVVTSSTGTGTTATSSVNQPVIFTATITPQFPNASLAGPTGTVAFFDNNNTAAPLCTGVPVTAGSGGTATASCTYTFTATGSNTISVAYTGDANFVAVAQPNSSPVTQTVQPPNLTVAVTPPATALVNQTVSYSVLITPASKGVTTPTGKVTFADASDKTTLLCAPAGLVGDSTSGTSSASCQVTFLNAGKHTITATYPGDTNFTAGGGSATAVNVTASATALTLTSSEPTSFATQTVTFTAVVTPTPKSGAILQVPPGAVTFASSDSTGLVAVACPSAVPLTPVGDGTASATCVVTFAHAATPVGQLSVTAAYSDTVDSNFTTSSSSTPQTVQDFNVTPSVVPGTGSISIATSATSPGAVFLTQGSKTSSDLFGAATLSTLISTSSAYNSPMTVACEVYTSNPAAPLNDPSCAPSLPQTATVTSNAGAQPFVINATTSAQVGLYIVRLTTSDSNFPSVEHFVEIPLYVVSGTSASLSLATGASANQVLVFNTALGSKGDSISASSFSCPNIWDVNNNKMLNNTGGSLATCSGPATTITAATTSIQITIQAGTATLSQDRRTSSTFYAATVFGVPVLALLGWFGSSKSSRRNLYRMLSLILLLVGLSYSIGCGASVSKPTVPTPTGIPPGTYQVLVQAKGSSGNSYFAEVPLTVLANH